ncbi:Na+/H+ antiporter subunit E [Algihabitans sp.]|uniref:Na+/H+ antiporter subunit E n=1 Tax=Algihabitans sp. TaxID=2821514 RepID=UPI003BA931C5
MSLLVLNILLAVGWCALFADFTLLNLAIGFVMGFAALWVAGPLFGGTGYFGRVVRLVSLGVYFLYELVVSSLQVVWDVITPVHKSRPGIIAVPLDIDEPVEIAVLANLISLTPGTLSLDVSPDKKFLYVHGMFVEDPDSLRRDIKAGMERKVMEAMR